MASSVRLNKVIELLEHGQAVFSCGTILHGNGQGPVTGHIDHVEEPT